MRIIILSILLFITVVGCDIEPHKVKYPVVKGEALSWASYKCEFGVLYAWGYEKNIMKDIDGNLIPCTIVELTDKEYKGRRRK